MPLKPLLDTSKHRTSGFDETWKTKFPWVRTEADDDGKIIGMLCHLFRKHACRPVKCQVGKAVWVDMPCLNFTKAGLVRQSASEVHEQAVQRETQLSLYPTWDHQGPYSFN